MIEIDLPERLLADIDTIASRDYGDRTSVIRRLLARGVADELGLRRGPGAPDGPGDVSFSHKPDIATDAPPVGRPMRAWEPPILSAEEEAQRLAHAARRLREQRIARGLDPDTGRAPTAPNASVDVNRANPGASEDDVP